MISSWSPSGSGMRAIPAAYTADQECPSQRHSGECHRRADPMELRAPTSMEELKTVPALRHVGPGATRVPGHPLRQLRRCDDQAASTSRRYADAERVLRDWETFSSSINGEVIGQYMGDLILAMNGKEHRQYRNLVAHTFRASVLDRWDAELVRAGHRRAARPHRAARAGRSRARRHVAVPGAGDLRHRRRAARGPRAVRDSGPRRSTPVRSNPERAWPRRRRCASTSSRSVAARRAEPTGDLLSELVHAEVDGERLTDETDLRLPPPAAPGRRGDDVPGDGQRAARAADPSRRPRRGARRSRALLAEVIEETLRWETSVTMVSRVATVDTEIARLPDRGRLAVNVLTGSADRDDRPLRRRRRVEARPPSRSTTSRSAPARTSASGCTSPVSSCAPGSPRSSAPAEPAPRPGRRRRPTIEGYAFRGPDTLPVLFDVDPSRAASSRPGSTSGLR